MSNRQVIADLYKSFLTGDPEPALNIFTDESVLIDVGDNERSGVYRGVVEIAQHAILCKKMTDWTFGTDVVEIIGGEKYVVVIERALALRNGTSLNMLVNTVYQMRDGVVTEVRVLPYDYERWNEFWS